MARVAAVRLGQGLGSGGQRFRESPLVAERALWIALVHTAQEDLVNAENVDQLITLAKNESTDASQLLTAAIYYRHGDLEKAQPLLTAAEDQPYYRALAAMLALDQGETERARDLLQGVADWIQDQRDLDPNSAVPTQQDWQMWAIRIAVFEEASRKLNGPETTANAGTGQAP